jgi:hypothetical protein
MAIDRAPWNALVDDDGSNLVGSLWNKAAINTVLLTPIDASLRKICYGTTDTETLALAAYDNFRPTSGELRAVWALNPTIATAITGIQAEADGTQHLLINGGGYTVLLANQHANSAPGNKLVGPGFANYTLAPWSSILVHYYAYMASWVVLKAL